MSPHSNIYSLEQHGFWGKYTPEQRVFTKKNEKWSSVTSVKSSLMQQMKEMLYNSAKYERKIVCSKCFRL